MKLQSFIKANPPDANTVPAPKDLLGAFKDQVPDVLLELWRGHGFGFYGPRQLCLIDPRIWQATLDRWIAPTPDAVRRTPIALTPFGRLIFYRRLTETDEDVAALDPTAPSIDILTWDLAEFFNDHMGDPESADALIPSETLEVARREHGALKPGEVYEADPALLPAQVLKFRRADGLRMHKRLRELVDAPEPSDADPQTTIADLLPVEFHETFAGAEGRDDSGRVDAGLYFSSYVDRHRLLALNPDGTYRLLFWMTDARALNPSEPRLYQGAYETTRTDGGDTIIRLDMAELDDSTGRDFDDRELIVMQSGECRHLLQCRELQTIAAGIGSNGKIDNPDAGFTRLGLSDIVPTHPEGGLPAPPWSDLPAALQQLVHRAPLQATITHVEPFVDDGDEEAMVMVTVDLGTDDGLTMNMPFCSPADAGKTLRGWVWRLDAKHCGLGIDVARDNDGGIVEMPEAGDILTSRDPSADGQL